MPDFKPAFYINITERCNMRCEYCPAYGENWESTEGLLSLDKLLRIVRIAAGCDIETFRISGGEPLIFPERVFAIVSELNKLGIGDIVLNTNGFNLHKHLVQMKGLQIAKLKVSLDTGEEGLFREITGSSSFPDVIRGIALAREAGLLVELNCVLYKRNVDAFWPLVGFCEEYGLGLKVLDLVYYDRLVRPEIEPRSFWESHYYDLSTLHSKLEERFGSPKKVRLSNDRGIPMLQFNLRNGQKLTLKDGQLGSTFGKVCDSCRHFPCQEGLFHLSLSAGGNLTPCRLRRDLVVDLSPLDELEIGLAFEKALGSYGDVRYLERTVKFPVDTKPELVQIGGDER